MNSDTMIGLAKKSYDNLKNYDFEWRSYYNGYLQALAENFPKKSKLRFVLLFVFITLLNGANDIAFMYFRSGEMDWSFFIYGAIHFLTFGGAYFWILKYLLKEYK